VTFQAQVDEASKYWSPEPSHSGELLKLRAIVEEEFGCRFVIAVFGDRAYRDRLIERFTTVIKHSRVLDISGMKDFDTFDEALTSACKSTSLVHVTGAISWISDEDRAKEFLHGLNYRRESLAAWCESSVVLWLDEYGTQRVAQDAPDFWAWRAGSLNFVIETRLEPSAMEGRIKADHSDEHVIQSRLEEIRSYLQQHDESRPSHVLLLLEMSKIERTLGELDEAERSASKAIHLAAHYDDRLNEAAGWGHIADIREIQHEFDEGLRIRQDEQLPVYVRLGEERLESLTIAKIADVLKMQGKLDQAIEMYEKTLELNETLGLKEGIANSYGNLGIIYEMRGELDRAVELHEKSLAISEKLGLQGGIANSYGNLGNRQSR